MSEAITFLYFGWLYAIHGGQRVRAGSDEPYPFRCKWVALCDEHATRMWQRYMLWEFECRYAARPSEEEHCHFCLLHEMMGQGKERRAA